ncbi:hypothetical protein SDC9_206851 [bioreactor metagenome]|uniref:Uncharacterized protein n=1 Tax=bioreactor metagenome TaxID=1076179 RepID=A0A645J7M4_9ZZZZ
MDTTGAKDIGISISGLKTIGMPNFIGSLIPKAPGTIATLPTDFRFLLFAISNNIKAKAR